jgi:hypothetical protein
MRRNGAIRGEEALGVPGRLEPLHPSFPLAGRLVRILGAVIQIPVLPMFHTGQDLAQGHCQLNGNI